MVILGTEQALSLLSPPKAKKRPNENRVLRAIESAGGKITTGVLFNRLARKATSDQIERLREEIRILMDSGVIGARESNKTHRTVEFFIITQ